MSDLPKYPPDGLGAIELQEWAARWSAFTRRCVAGYIADDEFMSVEEWINGGRHLHWRQDRAAAAYMLARERLQPAAAAESPVD